MATSGGIPIETNTPLLRALWDDSSRMFVDELEKSPVCLLENLCFLHN